MSPEERALAAVRAWVPRFTAGKARVYALLKPPLRDGERYGAKLVGVGISRVSAADPLGGLDVEQPVAGLAYGTSERLLVAHGTRVRHQWEWAQLSQVLVLPSYAGVVLRTGDESVDVVHRVRVPHDIWAAPEWKTAARWLALEGCFAASRGRLDDWLERLPARVLAA